MKSVKPVFLAQLTIPIKLTFSQFENILFLEILFVHFKILKQIPPFVNVLS
jgi:hypothetical protein